MYLYVEGNKAAHELKICAGCGAEAVMNIKSIYCSRACSMIYRKQRPVRLDYRTPEYVRGHVRVGRKRGKASSCWLGCESRMYHWANLTGDVENIWDYVSMCASCHKRFDQHRVAVLIGGVE